MKVYLISRPSIDWFIFDEFLTDERVDLGSQYIQPAPASEAAELVEIAGRLCYMSYGKGRKTTKEFIDNIIKSQHFSVLEHANWTFIITGVSRSLTHELIRHRHLSYSQLSQRYVDHSEMHAAVPPDFAMLPSIMQEEWKKTTRLAKTTYNRIVTSLRESLPSGKLTTDQKKIIHGLARSVLPEATETKIAVTGNARAWREFIQKRSSPHAEVEIRMLAKEILKALVDDAPELFEDLVDNASG